MAANATAVWRARPAAFTGTSNNNGGAFDCGISAAATGTHGSLAGGTFTDATAAAFAAGQVGSSINLSGIGQYKILGYVDASNISLGVTASGGAASGTTAFSDAANLFTAAMVGQFIYITGGGLTAGFYAVAAYVNAGQITLASSPGTGSAATWTIGVSSTAGWTSSLIPAMSGGVNWTVGSGQDYSQQNAPQLSQSSTANTSTATTTLTDTGASFTAALIGNGIWVSGTGITTTFTFITAVPSGTTLTLQTSPGTTGTAVSYNIGGAWSDFQTNATSATTFMVPGNRLYILGSGVPNPAAYTYDYIISAFWASKAGDATSGQMVFSNDPVTPGYKRNPDTTGGMPCIQCITYGIRTPAYTKLEGLWIVASSAGASPVVSPQGASNTFEALVLDQFGINSWLLSASAAIIVLGCELMDTVGSSTSQSSQLNSGPNLVINCNIHDCGAGILAQGSANVMNCIIAKNRSYGVTLAATANTIFNNTIDGNTGSGIVVNSAAINGASAIFNNIISNHVTAATAGIKIASGTQAANDHIKMFCDFNVFYNNTLDVSAISYGVHDTHGGSNPYVGQSTQNYTLA